MLQELLQREKQRQFIHVGLNGLGAMGLGIAYQISRTPGMRLSFMADKREAARKTGAEIYGKPTNVLRESIAALNDPQIPCDVFVEATNSIVSAYDACIAAIQRKTHCVLMNAEVDGVLGYFLRAVAAKQDVIVTSDAGDQHGVLARLIEEIKLWGFDVVQAGNMKGFLDRHQTLQGIEPIAKRLNLSPVQCLGYTDGSKLNLEMSLIANQTGLTPFIPGMEGPRANRVQDVINLFDFGKYGEQGRVDYILGAREHGGGVYVVGKCESGFQQRYLDYYKMTHKHPYYLFFRPYHLCHLETPRAIALAALYGKPVCTIHQGRLTDTYSYAKRDLKPSDRVEHAFGGNEVYGLINETKMADGAGHVPQGLLHVENGNDRPTIKRAVEKDHPLTWSDVDIPANALMELWDKQRLIGLQ